MNLYPEAIQDGAEKWKNNGILMGCPGFHLVLSGLNTPIRGLWQDGSQYVYVVGGNTLYQIKQNTYQGGNPNTGVASVNNSWVFDVASDGNPVLMFGNGDQLMCVANGYAYINSGSGPIRAQFQISGIVNTSGTAVTWVSGDNFSTAAAGDTIFINGTAYTIQTVNSPQSITLTGSAGSNTGATFTAALGSYVTAVTGAFLDSFFIVQRPSGFPVQSVVNTSGNTVTWASGSFFDSLSPGDGVIINGQAFTVILPLHNTMTVTPAPGTLTGATLQAGIDLGRQFNISAANDGTTWDALDFAIKSGYPDYLNRVFADREQLYLGGVESAEVWQNTGNALFPFQRIPGAAQREGWFARYAVESIGGRVYYLGAAPHGQPIAYRLDGFTPTRISTPAEEQAWVTLVSSPSTVNGFSYYEDGHQFFVLNFGGKCWAYDTTTEEWHQRAGWNGSAFTSYLPTFHVFVPEWSGATSGAGGGGMHIVADTAGNLYEMNLAYYDDNGNSQQWQRTLPHLYADGNWQFFGRMTLEMDTGSTSSAVTQPTVNRLYSDDRGNTFSNSVPSLTGGSGVSGAFSQRVFWPNNGSSRDRVWQLTGNNQGTSRTCLINLELEYEVGAS